jgi:hypothetical protein
MQVGKQSSNYTKTCFPHTHHQPPHLLLAEVEDFYFWPEPTGFSKFCKRMVLWLTMLEPTQQSLYNSRRNFQKRALETARPKPRKKNLKVIT